MIFSSLAPAAQTSYSKVVNEFRNFVVSLDSGLNDFPVTLAHICLYMCHLYRLGRSPPTIATKVSALAFWHKVYDPTDHFLVRRTLMGMKKAKPHFDLRPPLTLSSLHKMVAAVATFGWPVYTTYLIKDKYG